MLCISIILLTIYILLFALAEGIIAVDATCVVEGVMKFTWQDTMNFKLVPGTKLFDLCFELIGNPGTKAEISFDENGMVIR